MIADGIKAAVWKVSLRYLSRNDYQIISLIEISTMVCQTLVFLPFSIVADEDP